MYQNWYSTYASIFHLHIAEEWKSKSNVLHCLRIKFSIGETEFALIKHSRDVFILRLSPFCKSKYDLKINFRLTETTLIVNNVPSNGWRCCFLSKENQLNIVTLATNKSVQ